MLAREFADMGIDFLDLTSLLPDDASNLYFPKDRHLSPTGHRFVASVLAERLTEMEAMEPRRATEAPWPRTGKANRISRFLGRI